MLFGFSSLYIMMAHNIGFFAHANCNWYGGKMYPIEVAFADVHTLEVLITTVDNSDKCVGSVDERANKYCSRHIHRLPHNFKGSFSWNYVINWLKEEYRKRDNGLNLQVAVRGRQQKKILQDANLPVVELGKEFYNVCPPYQRLPSYEDDWGIDMDDDHWRLHRGTYRCSRRIAYAYSRYIHETKEKDVEVKNKVFTF
ncbi:hypothetical protein AVEN_216271-1 [Araneus ventricosus]|uniref:Uncharacterized protein n=1 Tax=Araneus ventricosus TaxID=182803 RepID=A0A4Y2VX50_ARAVE|nr:hypothetical protein AVEN_192431-1 [Araneus ventricosus]GBO29469.1 hypothetical protein AVEN_231865-1 [Araneus ventricosus]GBO29476.1 hypothetical protein AVEN_148760-1 [Araneus ventricosus]GBO29479.1 hypothetical protein AVEN_216271-1 [Araneus ventricosus]